MGLRALIFFFTLVTGPSWSLSLKLSDTRVYEPEIRARLGTTAHFCEVVLPEAGSVVARSRVAAMGLRALLLFFFITLEPRVE